MAAKELKIELADEPHEIARERIPLRHKHLLKANILYLFTNKKRTKCDRVVLGSAQKATPLMRFLSSGDAQDVASGYDFILLFDSEEWERFDDNQRLAIVAHELYHCGGDYLNGWKIRGHDVEEFSLVIQEFGFYKYDVKEFGRVAQQLPLIPAETIQVGDSENNVDADPDQTLAQAAAAYVSDMNADRQRGETVKAGGQGSRDSGATMVVTSAQLQSKDARRIVGEMVTHAANSARKRARS